MFLPFISYKFHKNKILIFIEKIQIIKGGGINMYISNTSYYHCDKCIAAYIICNNSYYYFIKLELNNSSLEITKDKNSRIRFFTLLIKSNNISYYSYFIYNKYYKFIFKRYDKYYTFLDEHSYSKTTSIYAKKLFNCRDYYKIHSYIFAPI